MKHRRRKLPQGHRAARRIKQGWRKARDLRRDAEHRRKLTLKHATGEDLGTCCACAKPGARIAIAMNIRAPLAGTGWGCAQCGLEAHGCLIAVCAKCIEYFGSNEIPLLEVVYGPLLERKRVPYASLPREPFEHDLTKHLDSRPA